MVKELKPKTDLIILLSHLGYTKDVELAQTVQGINIIVGGHHGINLVNPQIIKNTVILQTPSQGKFAGKLDLFFNNNEPTFYNLATKLSLEKNLNRINQRLSSSEIPEAEKTQLQKVRENTERNLNQLQGKNEFINTIIPLHDQMKEDPDIKKIVEAYKANNPTTGNPAPPK
jgi:2',3'-cyclic-nucleotide 2'-phosphodiesterase (5'-nucleotidase family)